MTTELLPRLAPAFRKPRAQRDCHGDTRPLLGEHGYHQVSRAERRPRRATARCTDRLGGEVLGQLQRRVVKRVVTLRQDQRHIHRRSVRRELGKRNSTCEHRDNPTVMRELIDLPPFRAVADHEQGCTIDARGDINRLFEGMKTPKASNPTDHEPIVQSESPPRRARLGALSEEIQVDTSRCDDDPIVPSAEMAHPLRHHLGPTCDEVGTVQRRLLPATFEPLTPSWPPNAPLRRLPDQGGRDEQHGGAPERASKIKTLELKQLVALPHESDVRFRPRSFRVDTEMLTSAPLPDILCSGLEDGGDSPTPR
jgi:hypothetical protein